MRGRDIRRDGGGGSGWTQRCYRSTSRKRVIEGDRRLRGYGGFETNYGWTRRQEEEGWELVQRRKRYVNGRRSGFVKLDIAQSKAFVGEDQSQVTTYYLCNFGNEINTKYLFGILGCYGVLQVVVIPARRNQLRRRFGFAHFRRVQDPEHFAIMLDNVFVGGEKLFADLSRFQREPN